MHGEQKSRSGCARLPGWFFFTILPPLPILAKVPSCSLPVTHGHIALANIINRRGSQNIRDRQQKGFKCRLCGLACIPIWQREKNLPWVVAGLKRSDLGQGR